MNPTSQEYYITLEMLAEKLDLFRTRQSEMKSLILKIFEENKRNVNEIKTDLAEKNEKLSKLNELEQNLEAAIAAKNMAVEMWQDALSELRKQEELLIGKKSILESNRTQNDVLVEQMKKSYMENLDVLSTEVTNYRSKLSTVSEDLKSKNIELEKSNKDLELTRNQLSSCQMLNKELSEQKVTLEEKLKALQSLVQETENFLLTTREEMALVKADNHEMSSLVSDLKAQNGKMQNDIGVFKKDAKESLLAAQEAILQKKEMAYREEQYLKEIEHLKLSIDIEIEKVELKHKADLKDVQNQCQKKIQNLMNEIKLLHQENSDRQSLFEKAVRENQALESKLELLNSEFSHRTSGGLTDSLQKRLTLAERARDEFELKNHSLEAEIQDIRSAKGEEIRCLEEDRSMLKSKLQKLSEDFNLSSSDRIRLSDEISKVQRHCSELEKELKHGKSKYLNEISVLREESLKKQQELSDQILANDEHYKKVCGDLQKFLDAAFTINSKWREEAEDLVMKSETKIKELSNTIICLETQNDELMNALARQSSLQF